eukprot:m.302808 g.302808  ORF g.302808 m.302808 type:complete len:310 (-) comp15475_c0_seq1:345-1274(-)
MDVIQEVEDDYESLPETAGPLTHMCAGALAGILEHTAMYPFDVVKTRMQRLNPPPDAVYHNLRHGFRTIWVREGPRALYRGIGAVVAGAGPAHALYFSVYEHAKDQLGANQPGHNPLRTAGAAVFATIAHEGVMNPSEVVKQRLQVYSKSRYTGIFDTISKIYRTEGFFAFYRSYTTVLLMNIPFQCSHLVTYETLRKALNPQGDYDPATHVIAGGAAGAFASITTHPLDVAKTLLNVQEECPGARAVNAELLVGRRYITGVVAAMQTIYTVGGLRAFGKGLIPRVMFVTPAAAISWSVYEFFKHWLVN